MQTPDQAQTQAQAQEQNPDTMLFAHATVFLVNGESFELLPFASAEDVKSEFNDFIESWVKSGFLLRGRRIYPWHQVVRIEITSVEEMSHSVAAQRLTEWEINDLYRIQQDFWRTKKPRARKGEKGEGGSAHP
jgi:hypothetical protein